MKQLLTILAFLIAVFAYSQNKETGDSALIAKNYTKAIETYEKVVKSAPTSAAYNNLANAYYRNKNVPKAILNYQRALKIDASNDVADYNLRVCNAKLQDRFGEPEGLFFITWLSEVIASKSSRTWGGWALMAMVLTLICFAGYKIPSDIRWRKTSFFAMLFFALMLIAFNVFAAIQAYTIANTEKAVLMKAEKVYDSPSDHAKVVNNLHEGVTLVLLSEKTKEGFVLVRLPDEKEGWIKNEALEKV